MHFVCTSKHAMFSYMLSDAANIVLEKVTT